MGPYGVKIPWKRETFKEMKMYKLTFMAYEPRLSWHASPDVYTRWANTSLGWSALCWSSCCKATSNSGTTSSQPHRMERAYRSKHPSGWHQEHSHLCFRLWMRCLLARGIDANLSPVVVDDWAGPQAWQDLTRFSPLDFSLLSPDLGFSSY